ncbi:type III secretion system chaperone [Endozoicomonas montiporae]|uniref:Protein DspF n=1 Tax=Endozoicomonas montiporae CL-33 TaxID=570277 RepID=A0A142BJA7_9GAMM|nr:type III secretion system chaperone [Endozoicomonas montiporae]AMO58833.1 protein DspF [Endozoicomonas montiporae CL-33]
MTDSQERFEQLIKHLSDISGHEFPISNNACTLINETDEVAAIIELPEGSDLLLFHSMVSRLPSEPEVRYGRALQLLNLNNSPEKLRGAWFAIDGEGFGIHLMSSSPIYSLSEGQFENLLFNYIQLTEELRQQLTEEELEISPPLSPFEGLQV